MSSPEDLNEPSVTGPVAIVMSRFPVVTETFILRELDELERQGVPVVLVPLLREDPETVHEQARPWIARAIFTPLFDRQIARDVLRELGRRPLRLLLLFARTAWDARSSLNALAGVIGFFPKSVSLGRRIRALGVRHVHAHFATHPGLAALVMSRLGGRKRVPFSMTVHAHDIFVSQAGLRTKVGASAFTRCISEFNARFLRERLGAAASGAGKLPVIHCGIEPAKYSVEHSHAPQDGAPLRLLCIAALKPYKGVAHLVDAVGISRREGLDVRCRVIGAGPLREALLERIRGEGIEGHVSLDGTRTQEEVARALAECDAFVLPSIVADDGQMEGIPVALMEALASGIPVIATRLSGIPELVVDGRTGTLVEPASPRALADAFRNLREHPDQALSHALAGRALVEDQFELTGVVRALASALDAGGARIDDDEIRSLARPALGLGPADRAGVQSIKRGSDAIVARLLLPAAVGRPRQVIAKQHLEREGASAPAAERARREHAALTALVAEGLAVPRPLALDGATLVMEHVPGVPASAAFRAARSDREEALRVAGAAWFWLDQLRHAVGPARDRRAFTPEAVVGRLRRELREDADACIERGFPQGLVRSLRLRCHRELPDAVPRETCWTHGDFWPGNVLVASREGWEISRITVIDLEGLQPGLPLEDAANFLEHVALSLPSILSLSRFDRAREEIEAVVLTGHGSRATIPQALRVAKALRLAARAPGLVKGSRRQRMLLRLRMLARLLEVRP